MFDFNFSNLQRFTLPSGITSSDTTVVVPDTVADDIDAALPSSGGRYPLLISQTAIPSPGDKIEIVYVTAVDTVNDQLTVGRGQDGTTAQDWASGATAQNAITAGSLAAMATERRAVTHPQIACLEAEKLISAVTLGDKTEIVIPDGYDAWVWLLHLIPINLDLGGLSTDSFRLNIGTTDGGSEVSANDLFLGVSQVGERLYGYAPNDNVRGRGRFYIENVEAGDANTADLRVIAEVLMIPSSKTGV